MAHSGDTILVASGAYRERIVIGISVTLQAIHGKVVLDGRNTGTVVMVNPGVQTTVDGLTIQHGNASPGPLGAYGGGIYNAGTLLLSHSTVRASAAGGDDNAGGGGIYTQGTLTLLMSTVSGNQARAGGGIYNKGTVQVVDSTVDDNRSSISGAGAYNEGTLSMVNSTIDNNRGGGINNQGGLTLANSTVSANVAPDQRIGPGAITIPGGGGGLWNAGNAVLRNSIVAGNTAAKAPNCWTIGASLTGDNNLLGNDVTTGREDCAVSAGSHNIYTSNPGLAPLHWNGGPTETMKPLKGSPAIRAGTPAVCAGLEVEGVDQRGRARPHGGPCDIGAYDTATDH